MAFIFKFEKSGVSNFTGQIWPIQECIHVIATNSRSLEGVFHFTLSCPSFSLSAAVSFSSLGVQQKRIWEEVRQNRSPRLLRVDLVP